MFRCFQVHPLIMSLGGLPHAHRNSKAVSLIGFIPKIDDAIRSSVPANVLPVVASLQSILLVQCIAFVTKAINKYFAQGIDVILANGSIIPMHPFVLTCVTDGPGQKV